MHFVIFHYSIFYIYQYRSKYKWSAILICSLSSLLHWVQKSINFDQKS